MFFCFFIIVCANSVEAKIRDIIDSYEEVYFIDDEDKLWMSGYVIYGENIKSDIVSASDEKKYLTVPQVIAEDVKKFIGGSTNIILKNDGTLLTYGGDINSDEIAYGLGQGDITNNHTPTPILTEVKDVNIGGAVVALKNDGKLWAWGNLNSITGGYGTRFVSEPFCVMSDVEEIYKGDYSFYIHTNDGIWLATDYGEEVEGPVFHPPVEFDFSFDPQMIWSSGDTTFAIDENDNLWGWGSYDMGMEEEEHPLEMYTPVMLESNVKAAETIYGDMETDKDFIILKKDGTLWLTDTSGSEKIADNIKGFRHYRYRYSPDDSFGEYKDDCMYLDYNGDLFFMPDYKSDERELILTDVRDFVSDQFNYNIEHMFVEKNDDSLWVMGYNRGSLGVGEFRRDVTAPMQNLYNVETTFETTTEITTESITEVQKKTITESEKKVLYVLSTVVVLGGVMFCFFKVRKKE